jgi:hypothetical protein
MKTPPFRWPHLALAAGLPALAIVAGAQTFTDPFATAGHWSAASPPPWGGNHTGGFAVTNGRLEFTSAATGVAFTSRTLTSLRAPVASDWAVQVDVHLDNTEAWGNLGGVAWRHLSLVAYRGATLEPRFGVTFEREQTDNSNSFYAFGAANGTGFDLPAVNLNTADAALRLTYSASARSLTAWYDPDGAVGGYNWVTLGTVYIGASAPGGARQSNWNLGASDLIDLLLHGDAGVHPAVADTLPTLPGQAYFDNFAATGLVGAPRLRSLAVRAMVAGTGAEPGALAMGFQIEGTAPKPVLLRAVGPTLASFGVPDALPDPSLTVYDRSGAVVAANNDWGGSAAVAAAASAAGALALPAGSRDAALLLTLNPGVYSAAVSPAPGSVGVAWLELYETDLTPRLVYLAARGATGGGAAPLVAGFVPEGTTETGTPVALLRALGPGLAAVGLVGVNTNPTLAVYRGVTLVDSNDDWNGSPTLSAASAQAGLLPLVGSDAALLAGLAPGATYTAQAAGVGAIAGTGQVEIALVDPGRAGTFPPGLLLPLVPAAANAGGSVSFSAVAIGKPAPGYQWRKDGVNLPGRTTAVLQLTGVQASDAGDYSVILTNPAGTVTSQSARLVVNSGSPVIVTPPAPQVVVAGGTANFSVAAVGAPVLAYQWLFNGNALAGATATTLTLREVQAAQVGDYSVRVSNLLGSVTSAAAALTLATAPAITIQPVAQAVAAGAPAALRVAAAGSAPLAYQWHKDGVAVAGATAATLAFAVAQPADTGSYTCVVSNPAGSVTSAAATLTVTREFAGTYFGEIDGGRGFWALVVRPDRVATYVAFLNNPRAGVIVTLAVGADGRFRSTGSLVTAQAWPPRAPGRPIAAATTPLTLSGSIGASSVGGSLVELGVRFAGTQDGPGGAPAAGSGLFEAASGTTKTYAVVGNSGRTVLALTVGATVVDGGLGTLGANGAFTIATGSNTSIAGAVDPATGSITTTVTPAAGGPQTQTGGATDGLGPPVILAGPAAQSVAAGAAVELTVTAGGRTPLTYQWNRDGAALAGATDATLRLAAARTADAGSYRVTVTNAEGSASSEAALLAVTASARLVNLSILTDLPAVGDSFTLGYVVGGAPLAGGKPLVIRAAGPSLGALGVPNTLADPRLELFAGPAKTGENDNWGGGAALARASADVGAFAFTGPDSRDAAVATSVTTANNSVVVSGIGSATGAVIAEVYDATPPAAFGAATPRLINVSVLKQVGGGFTVGFVIGGNGGRGVLIRAVGPGLAGVGVPSGTLADPRLTLFAGANPLAENNDWGGGAALAAAMAQVGAFDLPGNSRDAALVSTLQPGSYSARVEGPAGATGVVLVEVYELP